MVFFWRQIAKREEQISSAFNSRSPQLTLKSRVGAARSCGRVLAAIPDVPEVDVSPHRPSASRESPRDKRVLQVARNCSMRLDHLAVNYPRRANQELRCREVRHSTPIHVSRWGLIPSWAKHPSIATKTINAMSETAAEKPAFRDALRLRCCLISADSFYGWQSIGSKHKQPFSIGMADDSVFALAGLWDSWIAADGDVVETCTILTTTPNALVADFHRRMPAILKRDDYERWFDPSIKNPSALSGCLEPFDAALMKKYPLGTRVNRPENDDCECAHEVTFSAMPLLF